MQFLYFLKDAPAQVNLTEWGLSHVGTESKKLANRQVAAQHMGNGLLVTRGDTDICRVDPSGDNQVWHKMPKRFVGDREIWCGWWLDKMPNATTLARKQQLEGVLVELVGGQKWLVPVLREYTQIEPQLQYRLNLPRQIDCDSDGELTYGRVLKPFDKIWERALPEAEQMISYFIATKRWHIVSPESVFVAGDILGINYHVSAFEVLKLGLFGDNEAKSTMMVAFDFSKIEERLKNLISRSQSSGTSSQSGGEPDKEEETIQATAQQ